MEQQLPITPVTGMSKGFVITGGRDIASWLRIWIVFCLTNFLKELPEDLGGKYNLIRKVIRIWKTDDEISVGVIQNTILLLRRRMELCSDNRKRLQPTGIPAGGPDLEGLFSPEEISELSCLNIEMEIGEGEMVLFDRLYFNPITYKAMERIVQILIRVLVEPKTLVWDLSL